MDYLRIWTDIDISEIENSILTVDDKFGFCPGCKEIGIKLENLKECPKCGRHFKYATSREAKGANGHTFIMRAKAKLPDLTFIDFDDYERITGKKKAESLFKWIIPAISITPMSKFAARIALYDNLTQRAEPATLKDHISCKKLSRLFYLTNLYISIY